MSPLQITIALHYHYCCVDFRDGDFTAPAVREALHLFVDEGLLEYYPELGMKYQPTEKLDAYVQKLCSINLPKLKWTYDE